MVEDEEEEDDDDDNNDFWGVGNSVVEGCWYEKLGNFWKGGKK